MCHETIPKLNSAHLKNKVVAKQRYCIVVESNIDSRATVEGAGPHPFTCISIIRTPLEGTATTPLQSCSNYDGIFRPFDEDR